MEPRERKISFLYDEMVWWGDDLDDGIKYRGGKWSECWYKLVVKKMSCFGNETLLCFIQRKYFFRNRIRAFKISLPLEFSAFKLWKQIIAIKATNIWSEFLNSKKRLERIQCHLKPMSFASSCEPCCLADNTQCQKSSPHVSFRILDTLLDWNCWLPHQF